MSSNPMHTPGPWLAATHLDKRHHYHAVMAYKGGKDGEGGLVASVHFGFGSHFIDSEAQANARLIAAAPDLLAALKTALPLIEKAHKSAVNKAVYIPLQTAMENARAAIAKAEPR